MKFIGVDLGWNGKPSGVATLDFDGKCLHLITLERYATIDETLKWVDRTIKDGPALIAIDAPTIIVNQGGMRPVDRAMQTYYGKYHAGAFPANLGRPFSKFTVRLGAKLEEKGFRHACDIVPQMPGRYQIEVFPHPAIVNLFNLQQIIKYKKGRVGVRGDELSRYRNLILNSLPSLPAISIPSLPTVLAKGRALKELEDKLDAIICAYVGAHWWYWGIARNEVHGSRETGYIVVPLRTKTQTASQ